MLRILENLDVIQLDSPQNLGTQLMVLELPKDDTQQHRPSHGTAKEMPKNESSIADGRARSRT